jgi:hypothetical protein
MGTSSTLEVYQKKLDHFRCETLYHAAQREHQVLVWYKTLIAQVIKKLKLHCGTNCFRQTWLIWIDCTQTRGIVVYMTYQTVSTWLFILALIGQIVILGAVAIYFTKQSLESAIKGIES